MTLVIKYVFNVGEMNTQRFFVLLSSETKLIMSDEHVTIGVRGRTWTLWDL
jgi:hypothetical protein